MPILPAPTSRSLLFRRCGDCSACCTPLAIIELRKPARVPCPHLVLGEERGGCGIYDQRPASCASYVCAWRSGLGGDAERPDRIGVLLSAKSNTMSARDAVPGLQDVSFLAHETFPSAFRTAPALGLLQDVAAKGFIVFALTGPGDERCHVFGPVHVVRAAMAYTRAGAGPRTGRRLALIMDPGSIKFEEDLR